MSSRSRDDAIEQRPRMVVELARGGAVLRMIEDGGEAALELPRGEEERPVDVGHDRLERHVDEPAARERRDRHRRPRPVASQPVPRGVRPRQQRPPLQCGVLLTDAFLIGLDLAVEAGALGGAQQARHDVHGTRRVDDVHDRLRSVLGRNLHRRVRAARRRAADEQRDLHLPPLHLARDEHHLVERRRDESAQANQSAPSSTAV